MAIANLMQDERAMRAAQERFERSLGFDKERFKHKEHIEETRENRLARQQFYDVAGSFLGDDLTVNEQIKLKQQQTEAAYAQLFRENPWVAKARTAAGGNTLQGEHPDHLTQYQWLKSQDDPEAQVAAMQLFDRVIAPNMPIAPITMNLESDNVDWDLLEKLGGPKFVRRDPQLGNQMAIPLTNGEWIAVPESEVGKLQPPPLPERGPIFGGFFEQRGKRIPGRVGPTKGLPLPTSRRTPGRPTATPSPTPTEREVDELLRNLQYHPIPVRTPRRQ